MNDRNNEAESFEKAKDIALTYLSYGMRTEIQVRDRLKEKSCSGGYDLSVIDDVLDFLREYGFVDDVKYAVSYIEYAVSKGHGMIKIRNSLKERGVKANSIEDAVYEYEKMKENDGEEVETEKERALKEALKVIEGNEIDDKLIAKVGRRLKSRGFDSEAVYYAVGAVMNRKRNGEEDFE